mmetsp:Transcript_102455/g.313272  ORF Transcript_102455/g.313272 Transcript_102455/m.313272 type:complete len:200 (-) Transcript_102455:333-932(-)
MPPPVGADKELQPVDEYPQGELHAIEKNEHELQRVEHLSQPFVRFAEGLLDVQVDGLADEDAVHQDDEPAHHVEQHAVHPGRHAGPGRRPLAALAIRLLLACANVDAGYLPSGSCVTRRQVLDCDVMLLEHGAGCRRARQVPEHVRRRRAGRRRRGLGRRPLGRAPAEGRLRRRCPGHLLLRTCARWIRGRLAGTCARR